MADYDIFALDAVRLQCGLTLRPAQLAYKTYGQLNAARDNVIVMPTFYGAQHAENETLMAAWPALDPKKYFIIVPNMFGNGCPPRRATHRPKSLTIRQPPVRATPETVSLRKIHYRVLCLAALELRGRDSLSYEKIRFTTR